MSGIVAIICFLSVFALLVALSVIDCKHYILPNELNALLGVTFVVFHIATSWQFVTPVQAALGAVAGGGLLLGVRAAAMKYYHEDALGLGDVKLMAAAGLGLGFPDILLTLSLGAGLGLLHGVWMGWQQKRRGEKVDFGKINVPAGLGLCGGIGIMTVMRFSGVIA